MDIKDFIKDNLSYRGNLFDHTTLPDPFNMIFQDAIDQANGILGNAKWNSEGKTESPPYFAGYLTNSRLNALAAHRPEVGCSVIIHNSTTVLTFMACMEFAARCNVRDALPNHQNGRVITYEQKILLLNKLEKPLRTNDDVINIIEDFALRFEEENMFGFLLFQLAMKFVVLHEIGHIVMGHSNFADQQFGLLFSYATHAEAQFLDPMLCQALEFIADKGAIAALADYVLSDNCKSLNNDLLTNASIDADKYMLRSLTMAVCILFHLFYVESQSIDSRLCHYPHPALRSLWLSMELGKATTDKVDFTDAIMNTMGVVLSSLHSNFSSPSFNWASAFEEDRRSSGVLSDMSYKNIIDYANSIQGKIHQEYGLIL